MCSKLKDTQSVLVFASSRYFRNNQNVFTNFSKLHVINSHVSFYSLYELGFSSLKNYSKNSVRYLLNTNDIHRGGTNKIIYQGHHGDITTLLASLVLPSSMFLEKSSMYVNYKFLAQNTKKILPSYLTARADWEILNFVSEVLNLALSLTKREQVISLLRKVSPVSNLDNLNFKAIIKPKNLIKFFNYPFNSLNNNYYLSDVVSRASKTMILCDLKFKSKTFNFF